MNRSQLQVLADPQALADEAGKRFVAAARNAIDQKKMFSAALAGGSTPKAMNQLLAVDPYRSQIDWSKVQIYFGDERCVPPDHADSNFRMTRETLLSRVPIPESNIHRMRGEIDPNEAATEYGKLLKQNFGDDGLDLILLGMGDDGHTASIFPNTPAVHETHHRCIAQFVENSTTGKSWRITTTAPFINRSKQIIVTVAGAGKAQRIKQVLHGQRNPQAMPIQLIQPIWGQMIWLLDSAAAALV